MNGDANDRPFRPVLEALECLLEPGAVAEPPRHRQRRPDLVGLLRQSRKIRRRRRGPRRRGRVQRALRHAQPRDPGAPRPPREPRQAEARREGRDHGRRRHRPPPLAPGRRRPGPAERGLVAPRRSTARPARPRGRSATASPRWAGPRPWSRTRGTAATSSTGSTCRTTRPRPRSSGTCSRPSTPGSRTRPRRSTRRTSTPARIWKVYGTVSRKGDSTGDRPHRRSALVAKPFEPGVVPAELLRALAASPPAPEPPSSPSAAPARKPGGFDLGAWLREHDVAIGAERPWQGGMLYNLAQCPFSDAHADGAYAIQFGNGAIHVGCKHDSCGGGAQRWQELRSRLEPGYAERGQRPKEDPAPALIEKPRKEVPAPGRGRRGEGEGGARDGGPRPLLSRLLRPRPRRRRHPRPLPRDVDRVPDGPQLARAPRLRHGRERRRGSRAA